jgi:molybdenum cofactor cytidylyltransferase
LKAALLAKTIAVTRERIATIGSKLIAERVAAHDAAAVARELGALAPRCDIVLVLGASAIVDRRDVVPAAIAAAGGTILHFGMPVDPGNLTLLARLGETAVLGLPGSARSPRRHGFDYVLQRLAAGLDVDRADIMRMGVGGLLKEIPGRPMPRARGAAPRDLPRVAAIVLAAGRSTRMAGRNKLLADIDGAPLVRRVVESVRRSAVAETVVVTGHEHDKVEAALAGLDLRIVHNPDYAAGLSTSLKAGIAALGRDCAGAVICLGDMPEVSPAVIDKLLAAFAAGRGTGRDIAVPVSGTRPGNPVLLGRRHFPALRKIAGDVGARGIVQAKAGAVVEVEVADAGIFLDLDSPAALASYRNERDAAADCGRH